MGKHKNTVLVQAIYGAFLRGDIPAIINRLDDNVEWAINDANPAVPNFGTFKGKEGVQRFFTQFDQDEEVKTFDPQEYIAQYDKVAATVHMETVVKKTGKPLKQDVVMVWTIRNGKVTHLRVHDDTAATVAAYT